jgi:hypothetical protein
MTEQQFEARIQGLEQANVGLQQQIDAMRSRRRRAWVVGIAIVALVAIAGAAGFTGDSFSLLSGGKQRIVYGNDANGKTAGFLFNDDKGGRKRMFIGVTEQDTPSFQMYAPDGELVRVNFNVNPDNSVLLKLNGRTGKDLAALGSATDGTGVFQLSSPSGTTRATILAPEKGSIAGLRLYDSNGKQRLLVGLNEKDEPVIRFLDADGKVQKELSGTGK